MMQTHGIRTYAEVNSVLCWSSGNNGL